MHNRRLLAFTGLILLVAFPALAQQPSTEGSVPTNGAFSRLRGWVQFEIVGGRIVSSTLNAGANMNSSTGGNGRRERISVDLTNTGPNIRYELVTAAFEINVEVNDGEQLIVRHARKGQGSTPAISVEYRQVPKQDLSLTVTKGESQRTVYGSTLWHLLLEEPEIAKQYLSPTLEMLRPGWRLSQVADTLEQALCQRARLQHAVDHERWATWVTNLASPQFAQRQAAERNLLEAGREVLPFLQTFDRSKLDAEQWRRIRNVIAAFDSQQSDTVDQTVSIMAGDPRTWLTLLGRDDEAKRALALEQLKAITGQPIEFDPSASAETRAEQLKTLQGRFSLAPAKK